MSSRRLTSAAAAVSLRSTVSEPSLNFGLDPANSVVRNFHAARKSAALLQAIDHRASKAREAANLGEPQDLYRGGRR